MGDLPIVKMFETGYKRTGDIQPARISAEAKAGNISQLYAKRLYLPDWRKEAIERNPQCRTRGERNRVSNRRRCAADVNEPMGIRTVLKRIERAEEALKAQSVYSPDCICFPENEQRVCAMHTDSKTHSSRLPTRKPSPDLPFRSRPAAWTVGDTPAPSEL